MHFPSFRRRIRQEPSWRPERLIRKLSLPGDAPRGFLDNGSLTERLSSRGVLRVERLYQGWQVPLPTERNLLSQPPRQLAMVREVVLLLDEVPVVFARSVFPVASVTGSLNHLRHLRNSSLGAILFSHPGMQRSPFEIARLEGSCDYLPGQLQQSAAAWCRRSRFRVMGKSLMVSEVFLERFQPWPSRLPVQRNQRGRVVTGLHHRARSMRTD